MGIRTTDNVVLQMNDPDTWPDLPRLFWVSTPNWVRMRTVPLFCGWMKPCYMVEKGDEEKFVAAGYELAGEADYEALHRQAGRRRHRGNVQGR